MTEQGRPILIIRLWTEQQVDSYYLILKYVFYDLEQNINSDSRLRLRKIRQGTTSVVVSFFVNCWKFCIICCRLRRGNGLSIRAGSSQTNSGGTFHPLGSIRIPPYFNQRTIDYDVAVISVLNPFTESSTTRRISLAPAGSIINQGESLTVTGWGVLSVSILQGQRMNSSVSPFVTR